MSRLQPLRLNHYDLIHAHDARTHTIAAVFARTPFVVSRRVAFPTRQSLISRWKYKQPKRYLAVSQYVAKILIAANIDSQHIDIVYDGVDVPQNPAHGDNILAPYTQDPNKGMHLAEQAAALANVQLIQSRSLEQDLLHARALLYLTQSEGLGSGILLAMAHGIPVIASNTGGIPELIENGITGTLVPNDPAMIAQALQHIHPALGAAARLRVQQNFTVQHMVQSTIESYKRALRD